MASKRTKQAPTDDIDELFEGIGADDAAPKKAPKAKSGGPKGSSKAADNDDDILAELENQLGEKGPSRPHTPRVKEIAGAAGKRSSTPTEHRSSEDKPANLPRKSGESTRSYHASFTPSATSSELQESEKKGPVEQTQTQAQAAAASGGGWWGGILGAASAAVKQAEAAYKEIQQNEEAKKWADQVRGNVGALRGLGKCDGYFLPSFPGECLRTTALNCTNNP